MSIMPPFNYHTIGHNGHRVITVFSIFTTILAPNQTQPDMGPLLGRLCSGGPLMTCDLWRPLNPLRTSTQVSADRTSDGTRASSLSEAIPSYKTSDGGIDGHDTSNGPVIPRSEIEGTKPPYVCPGRFIHTYSNNMINRFHVQ
jgi:hypothetical protein